MTTSSAVKPSLVAIGSGASLLVGGLYRTPHDRVPRTLTAACWSPINDRRWAFVGIQNHVTDFTRHYVLQPLASLCRNKSRILPLLKPLIEVLNVLRRPSLFSLESGYFAALLDKLTNRHGIKDHKYRYHNTEHNSTVGERGVLA